jgi:hypothetical protein
MNVLIGKLIILFLISAGIFSRFYNDKPPDY